MAEGGTTPIIKWGVLGCAGIAQKFCVSASEAKNAACVAIGSRSKEKAEAFAAANAPDAKAYATYDELLADPDVQAVYIPLPTAMRKEWVLKAASMKKHVLCEKPIALTYEDAQEMVDACKANGVQFMDNTMFIHHERMQLMKKVIEDSSSFGSVKHVVSTFTIDCALDEDWKKNNIRTSAATEPFGCLGDLGWYNIYISLWAFNFETPESVTCTYFEKTDDGVSMTAHGTMNFKGGRFAVFDCSFLCVIRQWAEIVGEKKGLYLDDFVINHRKDEVDYHSFGSTFGDRAITVNKDVAASTVKDCVQHARLVEDMSNLVINGTDGSFWPTTSLQVLKVLIACHKSAVNGGIVPVS